LLRVEREPRAGAHGCPGTFRAGGTKSYRSIWISDLHLGTRRSRAATLLDFLRRHEAENLFLVGDVIDGGNDCAGWFWSASQQAVVEELRAWSRRGARVELLAGNHDLDPDLAQGLLGLGTDASEMVYRTAEGRMMLVTHGHQFDQPLTSRRRWHGGGANNVAIRLDDWSADDSAASDQPPRSVASRVFRRLRRVARAFTTLDEHAIYDAVRARRADGIICGHIHRAEQRLIGPVWYINDGDWVESCTALVEGRDGALRLIRWRPSRAEADVGFARIAT
jgi:UDP-2,3-diacylglucosamine pyrophosphatase LpxH